MKKAEKITICEKCAYYTYDQDYGGYLCDIDMDEDDYLKFLSDSFKNCPYYVSGDEYELARKQ